MARFTDPTGREWAMSLTLGSLKGLKAAGCDLGEAVRSGAWLGELIFGDPERMAAVFWELVRDQATAAGITREQFDCLLDAPTIDRAADALQSEIVDFFHRGRGPAIKKQLPRLTERIGEAMEKAAAGAADRAMEAMDSTSNGSGSSSADSSASTPAPSPSGSSSG